MPDNNDPQTDQSVLISGRPRKSRFKRVLVFLASTVMILILVVASYLGWQYYKAKEMASQYAREAAQLAEQSDVPGLNLNTLKPSTPFASSAATGAVVPSADLSETGNATDARNSSQSTGPSLSTPPSQPSSANANQNYQALMKGTYGNVIQTMENVKADTLALQNRKLSISAYKKSILASKSAFQKAQSFVQANPPQNAELQRPYQDFLSGINLATRSMDVVVEGISSLSVSNFYAARSMGKTARDQVTAAYQLFH